VERPSHRAAEPPQASGTEWTPRIAALPAWRRVWLRALLGAASLAAVGAGVVIGYEQYPDQRPPRDAGAERLIASHFGVPSDADDSLIGDYLVERFYVLDEHGNRYVADLCKGRVTQLDSSMRKDWTGNYTVIVDRSAIQDQSAMLTGLLETAAAVDAGARYLGARVQAGATEVFPVNYNGTAIYPLEPFEGPRGEDVFAFLAGLDFNAVSSGARVINRKGTNYLLSNTALFPYFREVFGVGKALIISHLIFLDDPNRP
jgi:hypothetical protein